LHPIIYAFNYNRLIQQLIKFSIVIINCNLLTTSDSAVGTLEACNSQLKLLLLLLLLLQHPFNGLYLQTIWVSRYQKSKPFWILLEQEIMRWQ